MRNHKKIYLSAITLVIAGLVITSAVSLAAPVPTDSVSRHKQFSKQITMQPTDVALQSARAPAINADMITVAPAKTMNPLDTNPAFELPDDQLHPGYARVVAGDIHVAAYRTPVEGVGDVIWTFSTDGGVAWDLGITFHIQGGAALEGDYPAVRLWEGNRFFGTMISPGFGDGAFIFTLDIPDPTNYETWVGGGADWSSLGFFDCLDVDIACDSSQEDYEWGFNSMVMSTTHPNGPMNDGPCAQFADPTNPNQIYISWFAVDGCSNTRLDIDRPTKNAYFVYDITNSEVDDNSTIWVRRTNFENPTAQGATVGGNLVSSGLGNLTNPAIAANGGVQVILAETDAFGDKDIVCFVGDIETGLDVTFPFADAGDEEFPEIRYIQDNRYVATFYKDGSMYMSETEDLGETWTAPTLVDEAEGEPKYNDITEFGTKTMYQKAGDADTDLWIADLAVYYTPDLFIEDISGIIGVSATVKNNETATANATGVKTVIKVQGGILGRIDVEKENITGLDIGESITVKTDIIFGLGKITVDVDVTCDQGVGAAETKSGFQVFIFSIV